MWSAVDRYVGEQLIGEDHALNSALRSSHEAGLPAIAVSPPQGKLLHLLARSINARRILEIGTLGGYSTIWLARALAPGGRLVTLEADARYAEVASANIARAGLAEIVELRVGAALETLPLLAAEAPPPFDLVFIDADKPNTPEYFRWALDWTRPGGLILADNVIRGGSIVEPHGGDPGGLGARQLHELLAAESRVLATTIQTVGLKGYDGFTIGLVIAPSS
jgi:predicted O-methyltransferase YrrM